MARVFTRIRDHLASGDVMVIVLVDEVSAIRCSFSSSLCPENFLHIETTASTLEHVVA